ncbi:MAG TPA: response regulator [Luteitalea sp.]|nr:response regulator [Luteitalea sp.]
MSNGAAGECGRVLIVEDYEDSRALYRFYLNARGWHVLEAARGDGVEAIVSQARPDVIVMDLELPIVDGWELTRRLKSDPTTASIAIVVLSARVLPIEKQRAMAAGCDAYLPKPCLPERLENELRRVLRPADTPVV